MKNTRDRNNPPTRFEPEPGPRGRPQPAGSKPAPGFLDQLKQRLIQGGAPLAAPRGREPLRPLEELDGAEGEKMDLIARGTSPRAVPLQDDEDEDHEPTVLLQSGDLLARVRGSLRGEKLEEPRPELLESDEEPGEELDDFAAPPEPETLEAVEPDPWDEDEVEALPGEIDALLEEDFAAEPEPEEPAESLEPEPPAFGSEEELEAWPPDEDAEPEAAEEDLEEQTLVGGSDMFLALPPRAELLERLRAEPDEDLAPEAEAGLDEEARPFEEQLEAYLEEAPAEEARPFEEQLEAYLEEAPAEEARPFEEQLEAYLEEEPAEEAMPFEEQLEARLEGEPAEETRPFEEQLEARLEESVAELEEAESTWHDELLVAGLDGPLSEEVIPFEESLEAALLDAEEDLVVPPREALEGVGLVAGGLSCGSCGASLEGVLVQRLLELTEALHGLQAEVRELSRRLDG